VRLRQLGPTGVFVSELGLGGLTFGREADESECRAIIGAYLEAGGNLIDTADIYGKGRSEEIIGRALAGRRDDVVLMSKARFRLGPHPNQAGSSRRHLMTALEGSLRRLGTDHLDVWLLHAWDPVTPVVETLTTMDAAIRAGKVRYFGLSIFTGWQAAHLLGLACARGLEPPVLLHPEYSLAMRDAERDLLPLCRAAGLAVLPWAPLAGGVLTGKYSRGDIPVTSRAYGDSGTAAAARERLTARAGQIALAVAEVAAATGRSPAQVALNWLVGRPGVTAPIIGARTADQLRENLGATGWTMDGDHRARLDEVSQIELGYPHDVDDEDTSARTVLRTPWRE
jgi:aryl-alcohol dehydrogenase-like predicted oxidoreductase